jgi:hypothetical protein
MLVADLAEVHRDRYPPAIFWQPATASRESCPTSNFPSRGEQHCDLVLVGGPLWVGRPALPIRVPGHAQVAVRQNGSVPHPHQFAAQRAFAKMEVLLAASAAGKLALRAKDIRGDRACRCASPVRAQLADEKATA